MLLDGIPREIRDTIYRFIFKNTKVLVRSGPRPRPRPRPTTTHNQWHMLLTCRQAHQEAQPVFSAEARLLRAVTTTAPEFCTAIPAYTRARARYLGPLRLGGGGGGGGGLLPGVLGEFPALRTCVLDPVARSVVEVTPEWEVMLAGAGAMVAGIVEGELVGLGGGGWGSDVPVGSRRRDEEGEGEGWEAACGGGETSVAGGAGGDVDGAEHGMTGLQACLLRMGLGEFAERVAFVKRFRYVVYGPGEEERVKVSVNVPGDEQVR